MKRTIVALLSAASTMALAAVTARGEEPIKPIQPPQSLNFAQFQDGRAADLRAQAGGPIANPGEVASKHTPAFGVRESIPANVREFKQVFGMEKITIEQVTAAIAALVTPNTSYDN